MLKITTSVPYDFPTFFLKAGENVVPKSKVDQKAHKHLANLARRGVLTVEDHVAPGDETGDADETGEEDDNATSDDTGDERTGETGDDADETGDSAPPPADGSAPKKSRAELRAERAAARVAAGG